MEFVPKKLYYKIREVCEIAGVEAHVLRFWETEFPSLKPKKSRKGQRIYQPRDIEMILEIRRLLYEDGYTIAGARKRMGIRAPETTLKEQTTAGTSQSFADASEAVESADPELLPIFDPVPDEAPVSEDVASPPAPDADKKHPAPEDLKMVRSELENILTLLHRE